MVRKIESLSCALSLVRNKLSLSLKSNRMAKLLTILALVITTTSALRLPTMDAKTSRRAALGSALPALMLPLAASAKYRPSLAEFKGYGGSPILDETKNVDAVKTDLSHAQLVANSCAMQQKMLGRELTVEEVQAIDEKIRKYYPNAKK